MRKLGSMSRERPNRKIDSASKQFIRVSVSSKRTRKRSRSCARKKRKGT